MKQVGIKEGTLKKKKKEEGTLVWKSVITAWENKPKKKEKIKGHS